MPLAWVAETAGILASASLLIALIVLLAVYDDKNVFEWRGITLNAVVSVLSTASKAALLYTTSELISQWKWIIFTNTRRLLIDFQRIDAASRGPLGSSEMIWRSRAIGWLRLGALVVVLSIAADPLNQQLVQYKQRVVYSKDSSTTISRAGRYTRGRESLLAVLSLTSLGNFSSDGGDYSATTHADFSMQSAILYGMDQPMENVIQQGSSNCPTGNCTWPPFESLAVCNRCTDVTARLESIVPNPEVPSSVTSFRLPNGLYLNNANGWKYGTANTNVMGGGTSIHGGIMMTTLGTANATETISAYDLDTLIWSMSMIRVSPDAPTVAWPDLPLSAMECTLFYCVNSYKFEVSNGTLTVASEQIKDARRAENSWKADYDGEIILDESALESIEFQFSSEFVSRTDLMLVSPASGSRFNISQPAIESISYYYQSTFASGLCDFDISDSKKGWLNGYYLNTTEIQYEPSIMQALFASQDLNATFTTLAASMSNAIRTGADETFDGVPQVVTGSKGDLTTFYRVVWPWISLHCFIVVTGVVFLLFTIRENKKHGSAVPMWKSSSLAVLNRGQEVAGILSGVQKVEQMEAMSKASQVISFNKREGNYSLEHLGFDPLEVENELEDLEGNVSNS